jgi:hypothetical protein
MYNVCSTDWQKKTKMESKLHSSTTIDWNYFRDRDMSVCYSFDEAIVRNDYNVYKIQDILFPNHGPHKGIKSTNIQRKNHNYIEYSYTMTYVSQHIKSNKQ